MLFLHAFAVMFYRACGQAGHGVRRQTTNERGMGIMSDPHGNATPAASTREASTSAFRARSFGGCLVGFFALGLLVVSASAGGAELDSADAFKKELEFARNYDTSRPRIGLERDPEKALLHYRRALALRPVHPENMALEVRIGGILLSMDDDPERQREGARIFEGVLETYDYMDYDEANPRYNSDSPQFMMITAAIYAAGYQEPERARATYLKGMEFLTSTYRRRLDQWKNEKAPERPSADDPFEGGPFELSKWESRHQVWEERQQKAASGDVFPPDTMERVFVASLLRYYVDTFGPVPAEKLPEILAPVIKAFPDSPFEKRARELIAAPDRTTSD